MPKDDLDELQRVSPLLPLRQRRPAGDAQAQRACARSKANWQSHVARGEPPRLSPCAKPEVICASARSQLSAGTSLARCRKCTKSHVARAV